VSAIPRITKVIKVEATTNAERIIAVLADEPIEAINNGSKTTEGTTLIKLRVPLEDISIFLFRPIKRPSSRAITVPIIKPEPEIQIVATKSDQKEDVVARVKSSLATFHE